MRLHRFHVDNTVDPNRDNRLVDTSVVHQIRRVFRLQSSDKAIFFDGSGTDYEAEIVSMDKDSITFRVIAMRKIERHSVRKVALAVSLIRKDNFEWVVQKGTELGVSEFIPLVSDRSEKKGLNMERARTIMIEACEQSGRGDSPVIREPMSLKDFLAGEKRYILAFHTDATINGAVADFSPKNLPKAGEIIACIGPEGGWTDDEVELFKSKGASIARLDAPTLRAETAAIAVATLLLLV